MRFDTMTTYVRLLTTYVLPIAVTGSVIVCGLWIVPDGLVGMYGNIDGKWGSWNARGILEWSTFLNFGPYTPLTGTGSLLLPNLPWLNPGALALAIPTGLEYKHLFSYLVYLIELTVSLYILFLELKIQREYAFIAVLLYVSFFFIPFNGVMTSAFVLYSLGPFYCHQFAAMNFATVALLRVGLSTFRTDLVWGMIFIIFLFIAFASAPISNLFYVPVYAALWGIVSLSSRIERRAVLRRLLLLALAAIIFFVLGLPNYMLVTAAVSARDNVMPPFLHPGMALLTLEYWEKLIARFSFCERSNVLLCLPNIPVAWVQVAALIGGGVMIVFDKARRRGLAITVIVMIVLLHFYFLLQLDYVLGRFTILGYHYIYWTLFPLLFAVPVGAVETIVRLRSKNRASISRWVPAIVSTSISIVFLIVFVEFISVNQPRMEGIGPVGLPPIAHDPVRKGEIHQYLEKHIALAPGGTFEGYAGLHLARDDGFVRKDYMSSEFARIYLGQPADEVMRQPYRASNAMSPLMYLYARFLLRSQFGNMFQLTDLWNSNIPTVEDYGQWLTKQMFVFNSDLLAGPKDDVYAVGTQVYKFAPEILAMLGVRYLISDGRLDSPLATEILTETSPAKTTLRLYEIRSANRGDLSPVKVVIADGYLSAVSSIEKMQQDSVVLLEPVTLPADLVPAQQARLTVVKGGYHITARSPGASLLVLPVQFSHCWRLAPEPETTGSIFRANLVQTGIFFRDKIDADLQFAFGLTNSSCRRQDGDDMYKYFSTSRSKKVHFSRRD